MFWLGVWLELQAYLPQITLVLFMALLPRLLLVLSTVEGIPSQSQIVRATAGKYFYFEVFNVFLGVTIFGTIFSSLEGIKTLVSTTFSANELVDLFGSKLPPVASYFITYVALRSFPTQSDLCIIWYFLPLFLSCAFCFRHKAPTMVVKRSSYCHNLNQWSLVMGCSVWNAVNWRSWMS